MANDHTKGGEPINRGEKCRTFVNFLYICQFGDTRSASASLIASLTHGGLFCEPSLANRFISSIGLIGLIGLGGLIRWIICNQWN